MSSHAVTESFVGHDNTLGMLMDLLEGSRHVVLRNWTKSERLCLCLSSAARSPRWWDQAPAATLSCRFHYMLFPQNESAGCTKTKSFGKSGWRFKFEKIEIISEIRRSLWCIFYSLKNTFQSKSKKKNTRSVDLGLLTINIITAR